MIANEWYSSAMVGLAISGATDWVVITKPFFHIDINLSFNDECYSSAMRFSFFLACVVGWIHG